MHGARAPGLVVRQVVLGAGVRGFAATSGHTKDDLPSPPVRQGGGGRRHAARERKASYVCVARLVSQGGLDETMQRQLVELRERRGPGVQQQAHRVGEDVGQGMAGPVAGSLGSRPNRGCTRAVCTL